MDGQVVRSGVVGGLEQLRNPAELVDVEAIGDGFEAGVEACAGGQRLVEVFPPVRTLAGFRPPGELVGGGDVGAVQSAQVADLAGLDRLLAKFDPLELAAGDQT
jgi:hypothetical protein